MVNSYVKGRISDKTMSEFIWLIYHNGLSYEETYFLADVNPGMFNEVLFTISKIWKHPNVY